MKPKDATEEEENSWQGTVSTIKKTIDRSMREQKSLFVKKISAVEADVKAAGTNVKILDEKVDGMQGM